MGRGKTCDGKVMSLVPILAEHFQKPDSFFYESRMRHNPICPTLLRKHASLLKALRDIAGGNITQSALEVILDKVLMQ